MMQITCDELDVAQYELDKVRPASLVARGPGDKWVLRQQPFDTDLSPRYLWTPDGSHAQIPLFPYLVAAPRPSVAMGLAVKLGAKAVVELYDWLGPVYFPVVEILRLHITLGHPVQDLGDGRLRFWCGLGFLITERQP